MSEWKFYIICTLILGLAMYNDTATFVLVAAMFALCSYDARKEMESIETLLNDIRAKME